MCSQKEVSVTMVAARTKINANGEVVRVEEGSAESTSFSSALRSGGSAIDVFGFNLEWRQLFVVLGVLSFMLGLRGGK